MSKWALITGASGEIGSAIAKTLAKEGYHLYLHYFQNQKGIETLLQELEEFNQEYIPIQADLSKEDGMDRIAESIFQLDALVFCAGKELNKLLIDTNRVEIDFSVHLHLSSPIKVTQALLPKLYKQGKGSIVFIASIWGEIGAAVETVYSAVKGGQIAFAKALSKEVARSGIRVNVVSPGVIQTRMNEFLTEEEKADLEYEIALGRMGTPEEVGDAVAFLLSEKASYITGEVLKVNGGLFT
ncbi:3-oxoacyl-[acyl-carrier protein] reductase [Bacillus oleivorans]|uniref:3-oxoacyl-[acyl-carrier protein] reductase n=1 Tax=Bacillus oleivorans TaxID=1448271 RepID=A0A285D7M9_9BACI|nr:SDR family oxidoreductase [Bacillus oleivorans]SNX75366.1 3-oxoacyl-[acyl-carrier protein] reductase [Bacillus oleivorans]